MSKLCTGQITPRTHVLFQTHTHIFTHSHMHALLLSLAEVVAEVEVARRFGDDRGAVGYGNILQV